MIDRNLPYRFLRGQPLNCFIPPSALFYFGARGYQIFFVQFSVLKNCAEVLKSGGKMSGLYKIDPDGLGEFEVFCDQKTAGGGWTVFQRRQDGSVDFFRGWNDYKRGFGNLNGEFWLGLDKIHRLTAGKNKKLRVDLEATAGTILLAEYSSFAVANEKAKYRLTVGGYSGENSPQMTANGLSLKCYSLLFLLDYADIYR